jgi:multisubunit Na+/H+ antiporter MnhG subunit
VTIGVTLARYIGPALINRAAGVMFLLLGLIGLIRVFKVFERLSFRRQQKTCLETE